MKLPYEAVAKLVGSARHRAFLLVLSASTAPAASAAAHFHMLEPEPWIEESALGDPQKRAPCGPGADGTYTASEAVATYRTGETITVRWEETIFHPGHFRIALAEDRGDLQDPDIEVDGSCNYADGWEPTEPLQYPVLLDNLFPRTSGSGAGTVFEQDVTLPDTPCENCTLQVIQFMTQHAPPCIYYHCANIRIVADGEPSGDGGVPTETGGTAAGDGGADAMASGGTLTGPPADATGGTTAGGMAGISGEEDRPPGPAAEGDSDGGGSGCAVLGVPSAGRIPLLGLAALAIGSLGRWWRRKRHPHG